MGATGPNHHWQQDGVLYFVTWHLADSLPQAKLAELYHDREIWLRAHPAPWDPDTEVEYQRQFSDRVDEWLDAGAGACVLRKPAIAQIVAAAIKHFDGERYEFEAFVVMPNHVHVMVRPRGTHRLEQIVRSWKGFTAREINASLGLRGTLWQEDYWDRILRNSRHWWKCLEYIHDNPARARLKPGEYSLLIKEGGLSSPPR